MPWLLLLPQYASAGVVEVRDSEALWAALAAAQPGDEIVVYPGSYTSQQRSGSWFRDVNLRGRADAPIVVRAAGGGRPVLAGDPAGSQNILNLGGEHYTFSGFELVGGSHGIRVKTSAHAVFEDLEIHDIGDVGLSMNLPGNIYQDLVVRRVHIYNTRGAAGECFYLGCNDDACQVFDSVIEFNWCHDTLAAGQGDGIELKTGSYNNIIRHNVIHDVKYPGITLYGTRGRGTNRAYGNVVWNTGDNGIQVVGDADVYDNLVVNAGANGIASKPSQGEVPKDLRIRHNTVVGAADACLRGNAWNADTAVGIEVSNNALFCSATQAIRLPDGPGAATFSQNGVQGRSAAPTGTFPADQATDLASAASRDLYPAAGSALVDVADGGRSSAEDFLCRPRGSRPDVGAIERVEADNPSGPLAPGFKVCLVDEDPDTDDGDTDEADTDESDTDESDTDESDPDTGPTDSDGADTDRSPAEEAGCGCVGAGGAAGAWAWLAAVVLLVGARRR